MHGQGMFVLPAQTGQPLCSLVRADKKLPQPYFFIISPVFPLSREKENNEKHWITDPFYDIFR